MKILFSSFIFVLIFCNVAFSQNDETVLCPAISISAPAEIPRENETQTYSATVGKEIENFNVEYEWSATGEITEGQGTSSVKILWKNFSGSFTVSLEVKGLPKDCPHTVSESTVVDYAPEASLIDKIKTPAGLSPAKIIDALETNAQLFVVYKHNKKASQKSAARTAKKLLDSLVSAGIERERITLVKYSADDEAIQFWLVPVGSAVPSIELINSN